MSYRQEPPNAVQIELTEGCNLRCDFCGLQGIRKEGEKNWKFMKPETLDKLCSEMAALEWNSRIEFAMHGEPTLHPFLNDVVEAVRQHLPRASIMMTSNGGGLLGGSGPLEKLERLFDAGLNIFAFDDYKYVKIGEKVREAIKAGKPSFAVQDYPAEPEASPHNRAKPKEHRFVFVQDISEAEEGTHSSLNNHAGSAFEPNEKGHGKRCAKPFRELSVRWDGNIAICCNDWRGVFKCGNILKTPLDDIWNGEAMASARKYLYRGMRDQLSPCDGCDALSHRVGLLPDKLGKVELPRPNLKDALVVKKATGGKSYTVPVKRPWEK